MQFNPNEYETVKERKAKFYIDHPNGRIVVTLLSTSNPLDYALFVARVYLSPEDQEKGLEKASGYALEVRDKEVKISNAGKEYESVNFTSWTENAEESAVGRALDNAGYSGNKKPSRDEMQKAQTMNATMKKVNDKEAQDKGLWCDFHKCSMRLNKNGNPFHMDNSRPEGDKFCNGRGFKGDPRPKDSRKAEPEHDSYGMEGINSAKDINDDIPF
jgi:hypothetical protein